MFLPVTEDDEVSVRKGLMEGEMDVTQDDEIITL
jgi:hypothetical protein